MESSDEEGEISIVAAVNYYFHDDREEPVSFSILPLVWDQNEGFLRTERELVLRGTCESGLQTLYVPVIAWKFELSYALPEIYVLSKRNKWIMLQKPRKSSEHIFLKVLITVRWLHFIKRNPDASEPTVWAHLLKSFSSYDIPNFLNNLLDHKPLIEEAARRDKAIKASKDHQTKSDDSSGEEEDDIFDSVCAICDDGGDLLWCNGRCLRSFHPMVSDGVDSKCASLGFRNKGEYENIRVFQCENCLASKHQCYACGHLGSSARSSSQEVFPCASATCGHFYHPECVSRLLHAGNQNQANELADKIIAGESFVCPAHKCFSCNQREGAEVHELQFAICRRCPKVYHRKCLPRSIVFSCASTETNLARAWENLLPKKRILIYCMEHKIDRHLKTPLRDNVIFPGTEVTKRTNLSVCLDIGRTALKKPKLNEDPCNDGVTIGNSFENAKRYSTEGFKLLKKSNGDVSASKPLEKDGSVWGWSNLAETSKFVSSNNSIQRSIASRKVKNGIPDKQIMEKKTISSPSSDPEMEKKILNLMKDVESKFDVEEYKERHLPDSYLYRSKSVNEKSMTLGKVEGSVQAVRTAMQKLEEGCSIEEAKALCPPEILKQICRWKKMLKVRLAPFFYGSRYTSYGRHFTQVEKLKQIIDRLQCYVQDGDTVVDFCCGSNDFSCLLKEKLEKTGKSCSFKNYDIIQAKKDFCFERRDWMSVGLDELPDGSQLIIGLNPPFGTNASLANQFIKKALEFKPKLIILIVPRQTERLSAKAPYQLIWKDETLLSGKAFYLPGSVDVNDKKLDDWNVSPPPLYLWSHVDWATKYEAIAQACSHLPNYW
ncbi:protein ENHANCED DOWNY MILDEW 2-like isoform X2 [Euphorbia lathyris]|uniref:protein ENHANCED DOWNY MILDEW 2-like isoform X2 n=1 Tax=Euphorbia lathyris TaxID=212925 RepID=UPI00331375B5